MSQQLKLLPSSELYQPDAVTRAGIWFGERAGETNREPINGGLKSLKRGQRIATTASKTSIATGLKSLTTSEASQGGGAVSSPTGILSPRPRDAFGRTG